MATMGVRAFRDSLSDCLRRVRHGEQIVVTARGRAIATVSAPQDDADARRVLELVRSGCGTWNGGKPRGLAQAPRVKGQAAARAVLDGRR
jgi:prevent-host-death family protein